MFFSSIRGSLLFLSLSFLCIYLFICNFASKTSSAIVECIKDSWFESFKQQLNQIIHNRACVVRNGAKKASTNKAHTQNQLPILIDNRYDWAIIVGCYYRLQTDTHSKLFDKTNQALNQICSFKDDDSWTQITDFKS